MEPEPTTVISPLAPPAVLAGMQRVIESAVIAVTASATLYVVGSVYVEAYYGRMSIDANALDLAPPYIALQATHVIESLLQYPVTLVVFYLLYRFILARAHWWRAWYDTIQQRFGRLFLLVANAVIVAPLVVAAIQAGDDPGTIFGISIVSEVAKLMEQLGVALIAYVLWLSFGPRGLILTEIRQRKLLPIALLFALYLLDALIATAHGAALDAELLMTGKSGSSVAAVVTLAENAPQILPSSGLIFVAARNWNYFFVEQQPVPPSRRPTSHMVPFDWVKAIELRRLNDAALELEPFMFGEEAFGTPFPP
jgi:hypothetical protein